MDPEQKIRTTVDIFGTTYKMVGTFSQGYMKKISTYVNENMETIARSNPRLDSQKVAVLALIQMADEYFQLRSQWDTVEIDRSQSKRHIEELRKAFELTEEKERGKSDEVLQLRQRIETLERENARLSEEAVLASLSWAERVEEWETKYKAAVHHAETAHAALQSRVSELEAEQDRRTMDSAADSAPQAEPPEPAPSEPPAATAADPALFEKYRKLQEEYAKLQNEFNEWIQLTQSETQ
jgi:cell division protein ZapA (FtsZ GTPase activity inhibitor)